MIAKPASFRIQFPAIYVNNEEGHVFKNIYRIKYYWHLMQKRQNEILIKGCTNESLMMELLEKIYHHEEKANHLDLKSK